MKTTILILTLMAAVTGCDTGGAPADAEIAAAPADAAVARETAALAGRSLASSSLPAMRLIATARGRIALSRVVSCALPHGAALTAIGGDGMPYSFAGALGLAPGWAQHAPSGDERRRVAECLRARAVGSSPA
jgi:hypothetical protein